MEENETHLLRSWAGDFGLELREDHMRAFSVFLSELEFWDKKINLTGLPSRERIVKELLLDSIIPAPFLPDMGSLLDVGSGAGFPAIPLKILKPMLGFHLVEVRSKRVAFLKEVIRKIRLSDVSVFRGRIETSGELLSVEGYDIITTRALAPLKKTLAWCIPYLRAGGIMVTFLGTRAQEEVKRSSIEMENHRLTILKSLPYKLPAKKDSRTIYIFKRSSL